MRQTSNIKRVKLLELGKKLGLNKENMDTILKDILPRNEHLSFSLGPPLYSGGYYGTVSINDFKPNLKTIEKRSLDRGLYFRYDK